MTEAASNTDTANMKLVAMENQAFDLVRQGRREDAMSLLSSDKYEEHKRTYSAGMEKITTALKNQVEGAHIVHLRRSLITVASDPLPLRNFLRAHQCRGKSYNCGNEGCEREEGDGKVKLNQKA